jgi:hypothetical protein
MTYVQGHESNYFENETIKTTIKSLNSFIRPRKWEGTWKACSKFLN